jgi:hypothetical protein
MPLTTIPLPYGLRDVKITPYSDAAGSTLAGTSIDFPYSRTFSFTEAEDFEELRGDDKVVTTRGKGASVSWELEGGGLSFEAVAAMYGGTVTTTGTTPAQVKTWKKKVTDVRPWFKVEGQSISDSGGDVHGVVYKCRATDDLSGEFGDGAYFLTGASGSGVPATLTGNVDTLYDFIHNETAVAIP